MLNQEEEKRVEELYKQMSDEELLDLVRKRTEELGRPPKKEEMVGVRVLKNRFGPWPRLLERAGVKEPTEARVRKVEAQVNRKIQKKQNRKKKASQPNGVKDSEKG